LRPEGVTATVDDVLETYAEKATIPGATDNVRTVAITIKATVHRGSTSQQATDTVHQIYADRRWRFALAQDEFDKCRTST
jgi:hypothetical protein